MHMLAGVRVRPMVGSRTGAQARAGAVAAGGGAGRPRLARAAPPARAAAGRRRVLCGEEGSQAGRGYRNRICAANKEFGNPLQWKGNIPFRLACQLF